MLLVAPYLVRADEAREREIYGMLFQAGEKASQAANEAYPFSGLEAGDPEGNREYLQRRRFFYETSKGKARRMIAEHFGITVAEAEAIQRKGDENNWPVPGQIAPRGPAAHKNDEAPPVIGFLLLMAIMGGLVVFLRRRKPPQPDWRTDPDGYRQWQIKHGDPS